LGEEIKEKDDLKENVLTKKRTEQKKTRKYHICSSTTATSSGISTFFDPRQPVYRSQYINHSIV
jgi:hypothetical protein